VHALAALPGVRLRSVSRLYATRPVGVTDQPEFRNAVVALDVPSGPDPATGAVALLVALKHLERAFGRRERQRWGPRELDLDLLLFGRHRVAVERPTEARSDDPAKPTDLVVPHRFAGERLFVLAPLADLAPRLVPPGWSETVATARARRERAEGPDAVRPVARWSGDGWTRLDQPSS
jgi:2-amino-4-hydroxy-6-hydroxymethyldihydropteridine diphosphokinase